jgi:hypothetical protein
MRDRAIAMTSATLGFVHGLVHRQPSPGHCAEASEDPLEGVLGTAPMQQGRHRDRAGVDHRVVWPVGAAMQPDRVEGVAARLDANKARDGLLAEFLERHSEGEWLRDRLDRERHVAVTRGQHIAFGADDTDAEVFGVGFSEFRDVGGHLASSQRHMPGVQLVNELLQSMFLGDARRPHSR